ncbi:hypothetical protein ACMD2_18555 [Ananas comosus]|uniref:Uncharacterized protein n=1 Tax=Ananas comosus TaxID=4615 RepID=A0A199VZR9_ANACO|nr:hypothetical protein ACMD2_18555 [Ananas comosus]
MTRKTRQRGGGTDVTDIFHKFGRKKIKKKSGMCRVRLGDEDSKSFKNWNVGELNDPSKRRAVKEMIKKNLSLTLQLSHLRGGESFYITNVYGPPAWEGNEDFRMELLLLRDICKGCRVVYAWRKVVGTRGTAVLTFTAKLRHCRKQIHILQEIQRIDRVEEHLVLSKELINRRANHKDRLLSVLKDEELLWKTRAKLRWLREGDGNTKYFHTVANNRRRSNKIGVVEDNGRKIYNEEEKLLEMEKNLKRG